MMVIEAIFSLIAPQTFFNNIFVSERIEKYNITVSYQINSIL